MINATDAREQIAGAIKARIPTVSIAAHGVKPGPTQYPLVVLAQPVVDLNTNIPCTDRSTFPVAFTVKRDGASDERTAQNLDTLAAQMLDALREAISANEISGSLVQLLNMEPGEVTVQGVTTPAYVIDLQIDG